MEMYFSSLVIEHQQEPEVEIERNSNRRHHWNSLTKVKNKLNRFSKGYFEHFIIISCLKEV